MSDFGTVLLNTILDTAWPDGPYEPVELAQWTEVSELMFEIAQMANAALDMHGSRWEESSVAALDVWLMDIAKAGSFEGRVSIDADAAPELARRARFAVAASQLEAMSGEPLNLPLPALAPDGLKGLAAVLYVLGGPARDYPEQFAT